MSAMLLDTSALIGLIERRSAAVRAVLARATVDPVVSVVTIGELAHGVAEAPTARQRTARRRTYELATQLPVLPLDGVEIADCYGFVSSSRRAGWADRWLVASAVVHDLELVTEDAGMSSIRDDIRWTDRWPAPSITVCPAVTG